MKAMILAAGRGKRLRPLTDKHPKPLLPVAGKPLIEYTIERLVSEGFQDLVINIAYLGAQIKETLGNGQRFNAKINYSDEGSNPLETAGGIIHALPLLGEKPFIVVNGDIATDFNFSTLKEQPIDLAHLILVPNPEHHPHGDFAIKNTLITVALASIIPNFLTINPSVNPHSNHSCKRVSRKKAYPVNSAMISGWILALLNA